MTKPKSSKAAKSPARPEKSTPAAPPARAAAKRQGQPAADTSADKAAKKVAASARLPRPAPIAAGGPGAGEPGSAKRSPAKDKPAAKTGSPRASRGRSAGQPNPARHSTAPAPLAEVMQDLPHGLGQGGRLSATSSTLAAPGSRFLNREMSWLAFNERVLAEAQDERNPLMERLRFTAICGSNLDEFFMVRTAGIHQQMAAGVQTPSLDGLLPREVLALVRVNTHTMLAEIETVTRQVLAALEDEGIRIWRMEELDAEGREQARQHYLSQIQPVLTPLVVDTSHPFPYISNLSLNLAVLLEGKKKKSPPEFARVKVPVGVLPRIVRVGERLLLLEDVIAAHLEELFKGRKVREAHLFRVTRNTDFEFDEEDAEDLLATVEDGLRRRRFGHPVRLEVLDNIPAALLDFLCERMSISEQDVFRLQGPLGTSDFMGLPVDRPDLSFPPHQPHVLDALRDEDSDIFELLERRDVLLHHPYDSFGHVLDFLESAAADPNVLAIKQTLYRTGDDPRLLSALRSAAEAGKQVVAFIELKARFDEQRNISWARKLERAGAHVVYGIAGLKTHAKVTLVVRREDDGLHRYVHIGTGNYNPKTARLYTDLSLLSSDERLGADASELFNYLTGYANAEYRHLLVAPDYARDGFIERLEREAEFARQGQDAWFVGKCNQLTDPAMIEALYAASQAGVKVKMVIRGVCCLRPGVPGLSEHIEIHSLLGRFLEHSRIYAYGNGGNPEVYFGSADWMSRNLDRRVEVIAPALKPKFRDALLDIMSTQLRDERGSWRLREDGVYEKLDGDFSAQAEFAEG